MARLIYYVFVNIYTASNSMWVRVIANFAVELMATGMRLIKKTMSSALFTHLLEHAQIIKDISEPSLDDYYLIPIE